MNRGAFFETLLFFEALYSRMTIGSSLVFLSPGATRVLTLMKLQGLALVGDSDYPKGRFRLEDDGNPIGDVQPEVAIELINAEAVKSRNSAQTLGTVQFVAS